MDESEEDVLVRNRFTQIGAEEGWALFRRGDEIIELYRSPGTASHWAWTYYPSASVQAKAKGHSAVDLDQCIAFPVARG